MDKLLQNYLSKQLEQPNNSMNNNSPLVLITMPPTPRMTVNWRSCLVFTPELLKSPKFMRTVGDLPIIIARKHRRAANYYLMRHRNLLPTTTANEKDT